MIETVALSCGLAIATGMSQGTSEAADQILCLITQTHGRLRQAVSLGEGISRAAIALRTTAEACGRAGWDGEGALAITPAVKADAFRFLASLPLGVAVPSVGAEPDGQLTFEWYRSTDWLLSLSIAGEGTVHWAAVMGSKKACGTEPFTGSTPRAILDLIERVTNEQ
jgi:hypothetical protein